MALAGKYDPQAVINANLNVYVNGVIREHVAADWGGDTTGGLPSSLVKTGTGWYSRTGHIDFAPQENTESISSPAHPFNREGSFPPREGDPVRITSTVNGVEFNRFVGRVGKVSANFYSGGVTIDITDTLGDRLTRILNLPPYATGAGEQYLKSSWVAHAVLDYAGVTALPAVGEGSVLHDGYQSGVQPLVGKYLTPTGAMGAFGDPYGVTIWNDVRTAPIDVPRGGNFVCVLGRASSYRDSTVTVVMDNGSTASLTYLRDSGKLSLWTSDLGSAWSGDWLDSSGTEMPILAMLISDVDIRVYTGFDSSVIAAKTTAFASPARINYMTGKYIAGVDARYTTLPVWGDALRNIQRHPATWKTSALEQDRLVALRGFENVKASEILDKWTDSTLSSVWVDEIGRVNVASRDRLMNQNPVRTVIMKERVFEGKWELGLDGKISGVKVSGLIPNKIGNNTDQRAIVYQPSNPITLELGKEDIQFISAPDEEDWIDVDTSMTPVADIKNGIDNTLLFNRSFTGSWWAIAWQNQNDAETLSWTGTENISASLEKLGQRTLKLSHLVSGLTGGGEPKYLTATSSRTNTKLYSGNRGIPMPIIRARYRVQWAEYNVQGSTTLPNSSLPMLEHDAGWWLTKADAQRYANALSAEVAADRYTFTDIDVLFDPTRQIGDTEKWVFHDSHGVVTWSADVLITGYTEKWNGSVPSQSVDVQVKSLVDPRSGKTYDDRSAAYLTYSETTATGATYDAVAAALPRKA